MGKKISDFFQNRLFKGDTGVWMIYFFLCMISLVEVYSASSRLSFDNGQHWAPMINHGCMLFLGFIVILIFHRVPCKWFMLLSIFTLFIAFAMLFYTSVLGGGKELNGTHRWVDLGFCTIQPSEIAKLGLIMFTAMILAKTQAETEVTTRNGKKRKIVGAIKGKRNFAFLVIGICTIVICGLIFKDNVSTAVMLFTVIVTMMFIGHVPKDLMFKGLAFMFLIGVCITAISMVIPDKSLEKIWGMDRMVTVKHRVGRMFEKNEQAEKAGANDVAKDLFSDKKSQTTYAKIAIANSNFIGRGPGNSIQRDFLQHAESDFIFAIIIEELGIIGAFFVAALYLILLIRVGRIAQRCTTFFPAFLVLGAGIMMTLQAFLNMSVAVGLFPVTGQTLPLISKGGTSIIIISFYIAMILSVSRYAEKKSQNAQPVMAVANGETSEYYTDGAME